MFQVWTGFDFRGRALLLIVKEFIPILIIIVNILKWKCTHGNVLILNLLKYWG